MNVSQWFFKIFISQLEFAVQNYWFCRKQVTTIKLKQLNKIIPCLFNRSSFPILAVKGKIVLNVAESREMLMKLIII